MAWRGGIFRSCACVAAREVVPRGHRLASSKSGKVSSTSVAGIVTQGAASAGLFWLDKVMARAGGPRVPEAVLRKVRVVACMALSSFEASTDSGPALSAGLQRTRRLGWRLNGDASTGSQDKEEELPDGPPGSNPRCAPEQSTKTKTSAETVTPMDLSGVENLELARLAAGRSSAEAVWGLGLRTAASQPTATALPYTQFRDLFAS